MGLRINLMGTNKEGGLTFALTKKMPVLRLLFRLNLGFLCPPRSRRQRGAGGPDGKVVSTKNLVDQKLGCSEIVD